MATMFFVHPACGAPSRDNLLFKENAYRPLGQFRLKDQICNMKVGRASDCCKRLDANAFAFKKLLEKIQYCFLRPIAGVDGVALIDPARRGRECLASRLCQLVVVTGPSA